MKDHMINFMRILIFRIVLNILINKRYGVYIYGVTNFLADYAYVIIVYVSIAFWLAVLIDGYLLPPFDIEKEKKKSTFILYIQVMLQLALQGFLAIVIATVLHNIPSPVQNIDGYGEKSPEWSIIRNGAIINIILITLSKTLQGRLHILFSRFDKNVVIK